MMSTHTTWLKSASIEGWDEAIARTRRAQQAWAAKPVRQRLAVVRRLRHLIAERADALAQTLPETANRSRADTLVAEVLPLADACRFLANGGGNIHCKMAHFLVNIDRRSGIGQPIKPRADSSAREFGANRDDWR